MLEYIPFPNTASGTFATSSYDQTVRDDKAGSRVDWSTHLGLMSAYYFIDDFLSSSAGRSQRTGFFGRALARG